MEVNSFYEKIQLIAMMALAISLNSMVSCSSEEKVTEPTISESAQAAVKEPEMIAFQKALVAQVRSKQKNVDLKQTNRTLLANQSPDEVLEASRNLILANGVTEAEMLRQADGNDAKILSMALQIYAQKTKIITNN